MLDNLISDSTSSIYIRAYYALRDFSSSQFAVLTAKLGFCVGSYSFDKNPRILSEVGEETLDALKSIKESDPDSVEEQLIQNLEESLHQAA